MITHLVDENGNKKKFLSKTLFKRPHLFES